MVTNRHVAVLAFLTAALFGLLATAEPFTPPCANPSLPTPKPSTALEIDAVCGVNGQPSQPKPEVDQNSAKNNFCATGQTGPQPQPITVQQMQDLQTEVQKDKSINFGGEVHPLSSAPGPTVDRAPLGKLGEGKLRVLEGYILIARQEGKEMVNCETTPKNDPASHDIHISIVGSANQVHGNECASVVVEMSPHGRPDSWNETNLQKVALGHKRVRVTGQLFFDSSHSPCIDGKAEKGDPHRSSLWEIHPIYKFEVCPSADCKTGGWKTLDKSVHP